MSRQEIKLTHMLSNLKKSLLLTFCALLISGFAMSQIYNAEVGNFTSMDQGTLKSTIKLRMDVLESITVGSILELDRLENLTGYLNIVVRKFKSNGALIWKVQYGILYYNERANSVSLSKDGKYIYVVGRAQSTIVPYANFKAIVMKVRISDWAVIWSQNYGNAANTESVLLIRRSDEKDKGYFVIGTSIGEPSQPSERPFGFRIDEMGNLVWSKRYEIEDDLPFNSISPTGIGVFCFRITLEFILSRHQVH